MTALRFPILILLSMAPGCTAPADPAAKPTELNRELLTAEVVTIYPVSVNGTQPPAGAVKEATDRIRPFLRGTLRIEDVKNIKMIAGDGPLPPLPTIRLESAQPTSSSIILVYAPAVRGMGRGLYSRTNDGRQQIVLNADRISAMTGPFFSKKDAWVLVMTHELGHAIGVPANSSHQWHDGHCTDPRCVMYPRMDSRATWAAIFALGPPRGFCAKCRGELLGVQSDNSPGHDHRPL